MPITDPTYTGCCCCCAGDVGACVYRKNNVWVCEQKTPCQCRTVYGDSYAAPFLGAGIFIGPGTACQNNTAQCAICHPCTTHPWRTGTCNSDPLVCFPANVTMTISGIRTAGMSQQNAAAFASILGVYDFALSSPPGLPLSYVHTGNTAGISVNRIPGGGAGRLNYDCSNVPGSSIYALGYFRFDNSGLEFTLGQQATWTGGVTASVSLMTIAGRIPTTVGSICGGVPTIWNRSQGVFSGEPTLGAEVLYDFTIEIGLP